MNGRDLLAAVWRRKLVALLVLVLTLAATVAYLETATKSYSARATLTLSPPASANANGQAGNTDLADFNGVSGPLLSTLGEVAVSEPVLADASKTLGAGTDAASLRDKVVGSAVLQTLILRIEAKDGDPQRAADIANAVANSLIRTNPSAKLGSLTLVDPATAPGSPVSPDRKLSLAVGVVLGLVLAVAAAAAADRRRNRVVHDIADVERASGAPVLARLGAAGAGRDASPQAQEAEIGALVARLEPQLAQGGSTQIVLVEAGPASGVPHLSQELAVALSRRCSRALALHGVQRTAFDRSDVREPLTPAMVGGETQPSALGPVAGVRQLDSRTWDLTVDERTPDVQVTDALAAFDAVVLDARGPAMDRYLASLTRGSSVLMVVRLSTASRQQVSRTSRQIKEDGAVLAGVVLT